MTAEPEHLHVYDPTTTADPTRAVSQVDAAYLANAHRSLREVYPVITPLAGLFAAAGHELYLVGGSVRDALLGHVGEDLDFTTDARPETILAILDSYADAVWDTGIAFGTISAEKDGWQIEITTFRADTYDGQSRNPEVRFGDSLNHDLLRRDFTVNAMAIRWGADGEMDFLDPLGGLPQLMSGVLDTPDAPEISFHDDPLRMLRACRFVSQLGLGVTDRVRQALTEMSGEITRITVERVRTELDKTILGARPEAGFDLMCATGLAAHVLPELPALQLTQDEHMQHKDIYTHSLTVLRQAIDREDEPDLVLRWAALMHDCGKPATRARKPDGGVSFHHHEVVGAKLMRARMRTLKYPKHTIAEVYQLIYLHQRFHGYGEGAWTDSAVRRYVTDAGDQLDRLHRLVRADCTTRNQRKARRLQRIYDDLEQRIAELQEQEDLAAVRPDLNGNDIMQLLGLSPGPEVGKAWSFLKELRLDRGPLGRDEAEAALTTWWVEQGKTLPN